MNNKILLGSIITVVLLVLMSFSPSITANVSKPDIDVVEEDVTPTPIILVLQLMTKLRNHKDIQNAESEEKVFQIIEEDAELSGIIEELKSFDCGCKDENEPTEGWRFDILCILFSPLFIFSYMVSHFLHQDFLWGLVVTIDLILNCGFT